MPVGSGALVFVRCAGRLRPTASLTARASCLSHRRAPGRMLVIASISVMSTRDPQFYIDRSKTACDSSSIGPTFCMQVSTLTRFRVEGTMAAHQLLLKQAESCPLPRGDCVPRIPQSSRVIRASLTLMPKYASCVKCRPNLPLPPTSCSAFGIYLKV